MKLSASHQAVIDVKNAAQRELLTYHHILTAIVTSPGKWERLERVGSVYDAGDSYVWLLAFTPRMHDAVIMETFDSHTGQGKAVRCYFLSDLARTYEGRSFDSGDVLAKMQAMYFHAVELQRIELNRAA